MSSEQEEKVFFFFRSSRAFQSVTSFYTPSISSVASLLEVCFRVILCVDFHGSVNISVVTTQKKTTKKKKKHCLAYYVGCSPVILYSRIFSLSHHVTFERKQAQGHRDISPRDRMPVPSGSAPCQIVALERMRSLSLSLAASVVGNEWYEEPVEAGD